MWSKKSSFATQKNERIAPQETVKKEMNYQLAWIIQMTACLAINKQNNVEKLIRWKVKYITPNQQGALPLQQDIYSHDTIYSSDYS